MGRGGNIEAWLATLGLEAYANAFAANDIDTDLLADLTIEDLREIGVSSVGHRRKIMTAVAALKPAKISATVKSNLDPSSAELRVVTVMFCDLVDSTSLSAASDPEDFREFIVQFRQDMETAIRPFGGTISQFLGDGVMASFGFPRASGYDAERAVAAGLSVIERVKRLPKFAGKKPQVRVGIATGLTVVGAFDSGLSLRDDSAIGDTPNLASRLQNYTEPNTMVIAQQTRDMVGGIFECAELERVQLKGIAEPVRVWKVLGRGSTTSRYEALRTKRRSRAFVGRKAELSELTHHCEIMRGGKGTFLVIEGETGIGKSRLVQHGFSVLKPEISDPFVLQCSPYSSNVQFFAIRYSLVNDIGNSRGQCDNELRVWLRAMGHSSDEALALIATLIAYPDQRHVGLEAYSSDQIRAKTLDLLQDILHKMIMAGGALVIEDIQWMDPSTSELMRRILPILSREKVVMLATSQTVPPVEWENAVDVAVLRLERLQQDDLRELVTVIGGDTQLSTGVINTIVDRSDGVPIFAEELALGFLDSNAWEGSAQVPLSLTESLLARLDRVVNGKRIASLAAAIGREAPMSILIAMSDLPASVVQTGIGELVDAGVIIPHQNLFGESVRFRHGLVRDAAYDLLLRRQRKSLHIRIAETVIERFPKIAESRPHLLADQWFKAEEFERAVLSWNRAGQIENARCAYGEGLAYFERALAVSEAIPPSTSRSEMALDLHLNRMNARICLHGFLVANELETSAIADLVKQLDSSAKAITALNLRWVYLLTMVRSEAACEFAFQIKESNIAKTPSDTLIVQRMCATSLLFCGRLAEAKANYLGFLESYDPDSQSEDMREGHSDHAVIVMMGLAECYVFMGEPEKAKLWGDRSIKASRVAQRQHDLAHTLTFAGLLHPYFLGDFDLVANSIDELDAIVKANPLANWTGFAELFQGMLHMQRGDFEKCWECAKPASEQLAQSQRYGNWWQLLFIDLCIVTGHWDEAIHNLENVRPLVELTEVRFIAEMHRLEGCILRDYYDDPAAADEMFRKGLGIATDQGADLFARRLTEELEKADLQSA